MTDHLPTRAELHKRLAQLHDLLYTEADYETLDEGKTFEELIQIDAHAILEDYDVTTDIHAYDNDDRTWITRWAFRNWWLAKEAPHDDHPLTWLRYCGWHKTGDTTHTPTPIELLEVAIHRTTELLTARDDRDEFRALTRHHYNNDAPGNLRYFIIDLYIEFRHAANRLANHP